METCGSCGARTDTSAHYVCCSHCQHYLCPDCAALDRENRHCCVRQYGRRRENPALLATCSADTFRPKLVAPVIATYRHLSKMLGTPVVIMRRR